MFAPRAVAMAGTKRKHERRNSKNDSPKGNKSRARQQVEPRIDPTTGQRSALPGLNEHEIEARNGGDDDLSYEDEQGAQNYLRAVRHEAQRIPGLLVAPKGTRSEAYDSRDIYEDGVGDFRGRYADGAYYATDGAEEAGFDDYDQAEDEGGEDEVGRDPCLVYFDSILHRHETLRQQLQQKPPEAAVARLDRDHPTSLNHLNTRLIRWWIAKLKAVDPIPAQVALMDKSTVLRLLRLLTGSSVLKRGVPIPPTVSHWAWALLARLPERGELNSEEIGAVRELGKRAVLIGVTVEEQWEEGMNEVDAMYDDGGEFAVDREDGRVEVEESNIMDDENQHHDEEDLGDMKDGDVATDEKMDNHKPDDLDLDSVKAEMLSRLDHAAGEEQAPTVPESQPQKSQAISTQPPALPLSPPITDTNTQQATPTNTNITDNSNNELKPPTDEYGHPDDDNTSLPTPAIDAAATAAASNTRVTIDMILTVAGEAYGQRDLLEYRGTW